MCRKTITQCCRRRPNAILRPWSPADVLASMAEGSIPRCRRSAWFTAVLVYTPLGYGKCILVVMLALETCSNSVCSGFCSCACGLHPPRCHRCFKTRPRLRGQEWTRSLSGLSSALDGFGQTCSTF